MEKNNLVAACGLMYILAKFGQVSSRERVLPPPTLPHISSRDMQTDHTNPTSTIIPHRPFAPGLETGYLRFTRTTTMANSVYPTTYII